MSCEKKVPVRHIETKERYVIVKSRKVKLERLALIKERHQKLIVRPRQELEQGMQDEFADDDDHAVVVEPEVVPQDN